MIPKARLTLCAAVVLYLAGDFFLFNGPLNRSLAAFHPDSPQSLEKARANGAVARVAGRTITASQLDRATWVRLSLEGRRENELTPADRQAVRKAALEELIDEALLASSTSSVESPPSISPAEIDERLKLFSSAFPSKEALAEALKTQGINGESALRERITTRLRIEKHLAQSTAVTVTDDEARQWFDAHAAELAFPERLEARHIFIATPGTPAEEAKKTLEEALAQLTAKQKDFPTLAKELSKDASSKDNGGSLGWLTKARLSPDFSEPLFSLPENQPTLIRTRIGWHILEVTARKPSEPRSFEDAKPEILAALEAVKKRDAIKAFREKLRASKPVIHILDPDLAA